MVKGSFRYLKITTFLSHQLVKLDPFLPSFKMTSYQYAWPWWAEKSHPPNICPLNFIWQMVIYFSWSWNLPMVQYPDQQESLTKQTPISSESNQHFFSLHFFGTPKIPKKRCESFSCGFFSRRFWRPFLQWTLRRVTQLSNEKKTGCSEFIGDFTTQLCGDYFINHELRIPINQPVFHGKQEVVSFFRGSTTGILWGLFDRCDPLEKDGMQSALPGCQSWQKKVDRNPRTFKTWANYYTLW